MATRCKKMKRKRKQKKHKNVHRNPFALDAQMKKSYYDRNDRKEEEKKKCRNKVIFEGI